jgi:streptogramin lyase
MRSIATCREILALIALAALPGGCHGSNHDVASAPPTTTTTPPPPLASETSVSVTPAFGATSSSGSNISLTASAGTGTTSNIVWSLSGPGSLSATTGTNVTYQPSSADTSANDIAIVTASNGQASQAVPINLNFLSTAQFNSPFGVAVDANGNVYVADTFNNTIRKITPAGVVSTLAGLAGSSGDSDGTGSAARFNSPFGIAVDRDGTLYVTDTNNITIRKVTPAGVVTTFAGQSGVSSHVDGTGTAATFDSPQAITIDSNGTLYITDFDMIRKITPAGVVTTIAGLAGVTGHDDGVGTAATFDFPLGITVDGNGNLFVADTGNDTIREITPAGVVSTVAGQVVTMGATDGSGTAATFRGPYGIAVDATGNLYVADQNNSTIRKITPDFVVSTVAGQALAQAYTDGIGTAARFGFPAGIALDALGNLYIAQSYVLNDSVIRVMTPDTAVNTLAGTASDGSADGVALRRQ